MALTADVISGVREKCEQSGIYHYISKPFDPDDMIHTVRNIISNNEKKEVLDRNSGLKNMGNNLELYQQVLNEYYNENKNITDKLASAIKEKRYIDASQIVHKIKSSSGSIGANALYDTATALEKALKEKQEKEIDQLHIRFVTLLEKLFSEIRELGA